MPAAPALRQEEWSPCVHRGTGRRSLPRSTAELACTVAPRSIARRSTRPARLTSPLANDGCRRNQQSYTDTTVPHATGARRSSSRGRHRTPAPAVRADDPRPPTTDEPRRGNGQPVRTIDGVDRKEVMYSASSRSWRVPSAPGSRRRPRPPLFADRPADRHRRRRAVGSSARPRRVDRVERDRRLPGPAC